jgi:hypothetical protein
MRLFSPAAFARTDNPLKVIVTIFSTYELKSVVVELEGSSYPLSYDPLAIPGRFYTPGWVATIPLPSMARGSHALAATATDANNDSASVSTSFMFDSKPLLSVASPSDYVVLRSASLPVAASCTDDDPAGCVSISVYANDKLLTATLGTIDQVLSLAALDGASLPIRIEATDSGGQKAVITRTVFIEPLSGLSAVAAVAGEIKDFSNDRVLYSKSPTTLILHDVADNTDTSVVSGAPSPIMQAALTPYGALYVLEGSGSLNGGLNAFSDGTSQLIGVPAAPFKIAGNFVTWYGTDNQIHLHDLATGTHAAIGDNPGGNGYDVASSGTVVYGAYFGPDINVFRYRKGSVEKITSDAGGTKNINPKTDGNLVVYVKQRDYSEIYLHDGAREVLLSGARNGVSPPPDYQVVNGWVAFARLGSTNQGQIWLRSPAGAEAQVTYFSATSTIVSLAPNGELIVANAGRLYLYSGGYNGLVNVASVQATPKYLNGSWQYVVGRTLFK